MATIWFVQEGEQQLGPEQARKPVDWCVKNLGLQATDWISGVERLNLTIGQKTPLGGFADPRFVVVKIDDSDVNAGASGWKHGFYLLQITPNDAAKVLATVP